MPQYNTVSLQNTYGQGVADRQASEINKLNMDAAKQTMVSNKRANEDTVKRQNTLRFLAGIRQVRANPNTLPNVTQELVRSQVLDEAGASEIMQKFQTNPQEFIQSLEGVEAGLLTALGETSQGGGTEPSAIKEYKFAQSQGFKGSFADWKTQNKGKGVTVNTGSIPPGYEMEYTPDGKPLKMVPIPGGPAAREIEAANEKAAGTRTQQTQTADLMTDEIGRAFERISPKAGGLPATGAGGAIVGAAPDWMNASSKRKQLESVIQTIEANIGFDRLQQMRANSPTGGALGQVSDSERKALNATAGNLDPNQPNWMFAYNLGRLYNKYNDVIHGAGNGERWRAPESDYKMLYEHADNPEVVKRFQEAHGYLPPGF